MTVGRGLWGGDLGSGAQIGKSMSCDEWLFPRAWGQFDKSLLADGYGFDGLPNSDGFFMWLCMHYKLL
jgi:hypothetical protein